MSTTKISQHVIGSGAITAAHVSNITTANITENTNLYHTSARARGAISVTGGYLSYDSGTGVIQLTFSTPASSSNDTTPATTAYVTSAIGAINSFTGTIGSSSTATTQSASDNTTKLATTAFVGTAITNVIGGAPGTLDTLNELAAAINDDASYASTLTTALATKAPLASPTFTTTITTPDINITGGSQIGQDYAYLKSNSTTTASLTLRKDSTGADSIDFLQLRSDGNGLIGKIEGDGDISFKAGTFTGNITAPNLIASTSVYSNNGVYYGATTLDLKDSSAASFLSFASNKNATFAGNISSGAITSSGNLHAGDGTNISMDGSANGQLEVDGNGYQGAIALDGNAMHVYHNSSSRDLILGTNETARLTIGATGGVNFHSNNLASVGTISSGAIQIGDSLGSGYGITVDPNTQYGAIVQTTESSPSANPNLWCRIDDDGTVSTLFRVQNNGYISIGNLTPQRKLHIVGPDGTTSLTEGNSRTALFLDNAGATYINLASSNSANAGIFFSDADANNRGGVIYEHANDALTFDTAAAERFRIDSSGNILMQNGSPEFHFGTTSATHANWRVAVQEVVDQGFEIASGTTSAGANALSDTYTTRFQITSDGEVKLPGTTAHTYLHIAANSGVGAANKYTSGSTTFTAGMDTAAGVPDNMYAITSGSSGSSVKALVTDSTGRVGFSHSNPNGLGRVSVHGTVGHGDVIGDPDISRTYTNVTAVNGSTIELVSATAFTVSAGDTCVVTWNKGSWASVMYDAQISFASGGAHQTGSFYHNNSGSAWSGHVVKEHYDNTGRTWINYGGSNQTVIWTFDFPGGYHPILRLKITAGGGSGYVAANEFSVVWTS